MGFRGRLEAIRAPTSGKIRKSTPPKRLPKVGLTSQLLGTRAERMSTYSGTLPTNIATERPASDQASKKATRAPPSALFPRRFHHDPTLQHYRLPDVTASVTNLVLTYHKAICRGSIPLRIAHSPTSENKKPSS
jgi:hypothetical protein